MKGYVFAVHCAYCDGECDPVTESRSFRWDTRAVAKCKTCNTVWTIQVQMITDTKRGAAYASVAKIKQLEKARKAKKEQADAAKWVKA